MKKILTIIAFFVAIGFSGYAFAGDSMGSFQYKEHNDKDALELTYWGDHVNDSAVSRDQIAAFDYKNLNDKNALELAFSSSRADRGGVEITDCFQYDSHNDKELLGRTYGFDVQALGAC